MIGNRSEHGKVCQVLRAQKFAQVAELFGNVLRLLRIAIGALADVPKQHFTLRAIFQ